MGAVGGVGPRIVFISYPYAGAYAGFSEGGGGAERRGGGAERRGGGEIRQRS